MSKCRIKPVRAARSYSPWPPAVLGTDALTQAVTPTNSLPNPYRAIEDWAKLPEGRIWGSTSAVDVDPDGTSVWVAERCGAQGFLPLAMPRAVW